MDDEGGEGFCGDGSEIKEARRRQLTRNERLGRERKESIGASMSLQRRRHVNEDGVSLRESHEDTRWKALTKKEFLHGVGNLDEPLVHNECQ
jgi:hypothetical protein